MARCDFAARGADQFAGFEGDGVLSEFFGALGEAAVDVSAGFTARL